MTRELPRRAPDFDLPHPPMVAMEANWPNGSATGWHSHPRGQLLYAIEGVMEVRLEDGTWIVPPNRALWIAANSRHDVRMCGDVKMRTVYIDAAIVGNLPDRDCVINVSPLLRELIVGAVGVPAGYDEDSRNGRLMRLMLDELRASDVLALHLPLPSDPRAKTISDALIAQPGDSSTAAQWGRKLGIAPKTIHRLFLKETGMSFAQWRQQARLLFALRRIANGEKIIDVAFDCGYASQSAFTVMFKKHFGVPPSNFYL